MIQCFTLFFVEKGEGNEGVKENEREENDSESGKETTERTMIMNSSNDPSKIKKKKRKLETGYNT
jgi:hypothetical protein